MNLSKKQIIKKLKTDRPRFIGLTIMSRSLPFFYKLIPALKNHFPDTTIIAGGPHVTADPHIIKDLGLKFGLRGDGENTIVELLKNIENNTVHKNISGLIWNQDGTLHINQSEIADLKSMDIEPAYELYDMDKYADIIYPGVRSFAVDTSRGCPFNCIFCSNYSKTKLRFYQNQTIFRQLDTLVKKYGVKWIAFVDDLFTFKKSRVIEICNYIIDNELKFKWSCITRVDSIDEELLQIMKKAGLYNIIFGVESGSDVVRKRDNKSIANEQYFNAINLCRKYNIRTLNTFIIGHPEETVPQMFETIKFSLKLKSSMTHYQLMSPLPGAPILTKGVNSGIFSKHVWSDYMKGKISEPFFYPSNLKIFTVRLIHQLAYVIYYFIPAKLWLISVNTLKLLGYKFLRKFKSFKS